MKKFTISLCLCLAFVIINLKAQDIKSFSGKTDTFSLGIGVGLDFGGLGGNLLFYPTKNFGLFAGVGYAFAGTGYNVGAKYRLLSKNPKSMAVPFAVAMYGYNAAVAVANTTQYNKFFYGPTIGIGLDFRFSPKRSNYWSVAVLVPFRSAAVNVYIDDLRDRSNIKFQNDLLPCAFSFGYRIILD